MSPLIGELGNKDSENGMDPHLRDVVAHENPMLWQGVNSGVKRRLTSIIYEKGFILSGMSYVFCIARIRESGRWISLKEHLSWR